MEDFREVMKTTNASVAPEELDKFIEWTNMFGEEGYIYIYIYIHIYFSVCLCGFNCLYVYRTLITRIFAYI